MVDEIEVRREIRKVLYRKKSVKEFHEWLLEKSKTMHMDSSIEAQELIWSIEVPTYIYLCGEIDYKSLVEMLEFAVS